MKTPSPVNSSSSVAALVAILLVFIGQPYQQIHAFQHHHHAIFTSPSYSSQSHRSLSQGKLSSAAYFNFIPQVVLTERRDRRLHLSSEPATTANEVLNIDQLITKANEYLEEVQGLISSSDSLNELEVFRVGYLGKNGKITAMMKDMRNLPKEVKPKLGEVVNRVSKEIEELLKVKKEELTIISAQLEAAQMYLGSLATVPTLPLLATTPGRRHPLSLVMDLACEIFENIGYEIIIGSEDSPEIENDFYNFEALGMPKDHPARDMQDTFYINTTGIDTNETLLLRTHTSAVQIREMQKRTPPFKIVVPGRVYRKDDVDATHYPIFHQVSPPSHFTSQYLVLN